MYFTVHATEEKKVYGYGLHSLRYIIVPEYEPYASFFGYIFWVLKFSQDRQRLNISGRKEVSFYLFLTRIGIRSTKHPLNVNIQTVKKSIHFKLLMVSIHLPLKKEQQSPKVKPRKVRNINYPRCCLTYTLDVPSFLSNRRRRR